MCIVYISYTHDLLNTLQSLILLVLIGETKEDYILALYTVVAVYRTVNLLCSPINVAMTLQVTFNQYSTMDWI